MWNDCAGVRSTSLQQTSKKACHVVYDNHHYNACARSILLNSLLNGTANSFDIPKTTEMLEKCFEHAQTPSCFNTAQHCRKPMANTFNIEFQQNWMNVEANVEDVCQDLNVQSFFLVQCRLVIRVTTVLNSGKLFPRFTQAHDHGVQQD